jgi:FkbM family methyltransferase
MPDWRFAGWRTFVPRGLRNWLRSPRASLRWWRSSLAFRRGRAATLDLSASAGVGLRMRCHPEAGRTFALFLDDPDHRRELRAFVSELPASGLRLFDLGAHYGFFTLAAVALAGAGARVLAVEPSPAARRVLAANLALAAAGERVTVLAGAVGAAEGSLPMLAAGAASEHYLFAAGQRSDAVAVPQFTLPALARAAGFAPSLIKLDIEGAEFDVLTAPANLDALRAWRAPMLLELHSDWIRRRGQDPAAALTALAEAGYEFSRDGSPLSAAAASVPPLIRVACHFPGPRAS